MIKKIAKNKNRKHRHLRVRKNIFGTQECPRLNVYRSNTGIYVQVINDETHATLASASTKKLKLNSNSVENATKVGEEIAKLATAAKITKVVFDRGGYLYHGKIKAVAEAARKGGLEF